MAFYVSIMASRRNGTLYIGSTASISRRVWEHREGLRQGFTKKYGVDRLVWFEELESRDRAFERERAIKKWNRAWKVRIIEVMNPHWEDLYEPFLDGKLVIFPENAVLPDTWLGSPPSRG